MTDAKSKLEDSSLSIDQLREGYASLCEGYEKLVGDFKMITKTAEKLEAKLFSANEKLKLEKNVLAHEAETTKVEKEKVLHKNKELYQQKTEADVSKDKLQMYLMIFVAVLVIAIIGSVYYIFHQRKDIEGMKKDLQERDEKIKKIEESMKQPEPDPKKKPAQ